MSFNTDTKLVDGNIPANTVCPWRNQCPVAMSCNCWHTGVYHTIAYSCASARAYDICNVPVDKEYYNVDSNSNSNNRL